jgi:hypothetical protein
MGVFSQQVTAISTGLRKWIRDRTEDFAPRFVDTVSPPVPGPSGRPRRIHKKVFLPFTWSIIADGQAAYDEPIRYDKVPHPGFDPIPILVEHFPNTPPDELDAILWGETGWPSDWNIPKDGHTPKACFLKHVRLALARREIKYRNVELIGDDPFEGTVDQIKVSRRCDIVCRDGTIVSVGARGEATVIKQMQPIQQRFGPSPCDPPRNWHPYLGTSDVIEEFLEHARTKGMTQEEFVVMPMKVFLNWLVVQSARRDGEAPPLLNLDHKVLAP